MKKKFYITTPIYYANAKPHIGHAYTTVAADVLARFHKLQNEKVFFLTGLDEHGLKIQRIAEKTKKNPQEFVDEISGEFKNLWEKLNIQYDSFIRTTDQKHKKAVQRALQELYEKGSIYKGVYEGLYCVGCEQYKTKNDLMDGKCPDHNMEPELLKEESYLLKTADLQARLIKKIEDNEFKIAPEKYKKEILSFLNGQELKDISISRKNVRWGIPLPFDNQYTAYVWMDAFLNYLTGINWDGSENIPDLFPPEVQLIGKDILRVHATMWPAVLMHLGADLPRTLFTHGHILAGGKKMSKTLGNTIAPETMIEKFGVDATRYLLMSAGTFGEDVDLTMERAVEVYQADLANGLGNLTARVLAMAEKTKSEKLKTKNNNPGFEVKIKNAWLDYEKLLNNFKLNEALETTRKFMSVCDEYVEKNKPWQMEGEDKAKVIYDLLESLRHIAWMIKPFMPETSGKIFEQLFADEKERNIELNKTLPEAQKWGGLKPGAKIKKGEGLFPRLVISE